MTEGLHEVQYGRVVNPPPVVDGDATINNNNSNDDDVKKRKKKDRGPYNRMWPKRFVVTFWTLDLLLYLGWIIFLVLCLWWATDDTWYQRRTARYPEPMLAWSATLMVVFVVFIGMEIATIILFSKNRLHPGLFLGFQCVKLSVCVTAIITSLLVTSGVVLTVSLGGALGALSLAQLIYGAVAVHRHRQGFYVEDNPIPKRLDFNDDNIECAIAQLRKDLGPYNRMWPKRFVVTWWTLELVLYVVVASFVIYTGVTSSMNYRTFSDKATVIVCGLYTAFLFVCIGLDICAIVLFSRASLWPMLYLTFQVGKTMLLCGGLVLSFLTGLWTIICAIVLFALSIGPLVFGAVVVHRNRRGQFRENWPLLAGQEDQGPAPSLQQVCCECGLNRVPSVYDARSLYSRSVLTPAYSRTGRDSLTLAAYSLNSAGEMRPGLATPPYSFKGSAADDASIVAVRSDRESRATFTSAELAGISE